VLKRFKLSAKFTLLLAVVFLAGMILSWFALSEALQSKALREVVSKAQILLKTMNSVRQYTIENIDKNLKPLLGPHSRFVRETVPGYSAREVFEYFRRDKDYKDFFYKEATLNPTNPRDKTVEWEADLVTQFRNNADLKEVGGVRDTPQGPSLYRARPIQITNEKCLACHSTVDAAPKSMIQLYGPANGFGWKHNEIIGAQIISVPMAVPLAKANQAFQTFMISLIGVFLLAFVVLNITISVMVIRPIVRMSKAADEVSTGNLQIPEFEVTSKDEIGVLAMSFNRLRRSLEKAMKLLE